MEGLVEGRDYVLEVNNVDERSPGLTKAIDEIVASKPDVIGVAGTSMAKAFQARTDRIPIVFRSVGDPVGAGLVKSLAHPGGNITGEANHSMFLEGKRLQILRELQPGIRRVLVVSLEGPGSELARKHLDAEASQLGVQVEELRLRVGAADGDVEQIFSRLAATRADAILFHAFHPEHPRAAEVVAKLQALAVPAMFLDNRIVRKGGLVSYGVRQDVHDPSVYKILARVLRGESPANIPVRQSTVTYMAFNVRTARAIGLKVPESVLLKADEVID